MSTLKEELGIQERTAAMYQREIDQAATGVRSGVTSTDLAIARYYRDEAQAMIEALKEKIAYIEKGD